MKPNDLPEHYQDFERILTERPKIERIPEIPQNRIVINPFTQETKEAPCYPDRHDFCTKEDTYADHQRRLKELGRSSDCNTTDPRTSLKPFFATDEELDSYLKAKEQEPANEG